VCMCVYEGMKLRERESKNREENILLCMVSTGIMAQSYNTFRRLFRHLVRQCERIFFPDFPFLRKTKQNFYPIRI